MEVLLLVFSCAAVFCLWMWQRAASQATQIPALKIEVESLKHQLAASAGVGSIAQRDLARAAADLEQLRTDLDASRREFANLSAQLADLRALSKNEANSPSKAQTRPSVPMHAFVEESRSEPPSALAAPLFHKERALRAAYGGRLSRLQALQILDNAHRLGLTQADTEQFEMALKTGTNQAIDPSLVSSAMAVVTTSGWGNEPETTTPGAVQPLMNV